MSKSETKRAPEAPADRIQILNPQGELVGDRPDISDEEILRIYRAMVLVRAFDAKMVILQRQGRIAFYGPITGQEAATIASGAALESDDWVFPALREAGVAVYRGHPLKEAVAQCMGNALDRCKGRQMPCHYTDRERNYVAMSSCIATQLPHAVGAAYGAKLQGDPVVSMAYLGDGATSEGDFHVAMNFAGVWEAPVVFFCQNNQWAITVPVRLQTASETIAQKANAYGFEGIRVDGNDALAVYAVTKKAVEKARSGGGPTFIEAVTYRMKGHTTSDDPKRYRDEAEVEPWRDRDPIARLRTWLETNGLWSEEEEAAYQDDIKGRIDEAIRVNEEAEAPDRETLFEDVYAELPPFLEAQLEELLELPPAKGH